MNWGIIGLGKIANKFANDLGLSPNSKLHAVASTSLERAGEFAEKYGAKFAFGSYEDMMKCPDLDVIYVATPHHKHCEVAVMCLKHKIPVLCEKPLAINQKEVKKMIATAEKNQTFLMEGLWSRFLPTLEQVLDLIKQDKIGKVLCVKGDFCFAAPQIPEKRVMNIDLGGGSLLDIGIYPAFLALLVLGKPKKIKALATKFDTGADASCSFIFQYKGGEMAVLHSSFLYKSPTDAYIFGEKGYIHLHDRFHGPNSGFSVVLENQPPEIHEIDWNEGLGFTYEIAEVEDCLKKGKIQSDKANWQLSLDLIHLLDKIRKKAGIHYPNHD